jgi:hypothetical protein
MKLVPRLEALPVAALLAHGPTAVELARRLLRKPAAELGRWSGVGAPGLLVLLGEGLPWIDGVRYLGREPDAPSLLVPTTLAPDVPAPLVERRLVSEGNRAPIVICDAPAVILSAAAARSVSAAGLERWLAA